MIVSIAEVFAMYFISSRVESSHRRLSITFWLETVLNMRLFWYIRLAVVPITLVRYEGWFYKHILKQSRSVSKSSQKLQKTVKSILQQVLRATSVDLVVPDKGMEDHQEVVHSIQTPLASNAVDRSM